VTELADSSAWFASRRDAAIRVTFDELVGRGAIAICDAVKLELLFTARNGRELSERRGQLDLLPLCPIGPREWRRALAVYEVLAHQGGLHHRRVKHPDLLVAAAAESAGLGVVHYDEDFETIAAVTGQATRWLVPRGSV
jgi:predicted nucleic acid-binding protein